MTRSACVFPARKAWRSFAATRYLAVKKTAAHPQHYSLNAQHAHLGKRYCALLPRLARRGGQALPAHLCADVALAFTQIKKMRGAHSSAKHALLSTSTSFYL